MGMFVEGEKSLHPIEVASFCFDGEVFSSDELFGFFENLLCGLHFFPYSFAGLCVWLVFGAFVANVERSLQRGCQIRNDLR